MTTKRTISRVLVAATVPVAMIIGAPAALAGENSEKDRNHWVCEHDDFEGHPFESLPILAFSPRLAP
jgi:hypothetical protein